MVFFRPASRWMFVGGLAALAAHGCADAERSPEPELPDGALSIVAEQSFGWPDSMLTGRDSAAAAPAGLLGRVTEVAEGSDSAVYILDPDYKRIVVFNPDGTLRRVITGGYGEGPGEFVRPLSLDVSRGRVAVLDYTLARVSVFDTAGVFRRIVPVNVPMPIEVRFDGDRILIQRFHAKEFAVAAIADDGSIIDDLVPMTDREYDLSLFGEAGVLSDDADGDFMFAHGSPGTWRKVTSDGAPELGGELFPGIKGQFVRRNGLDVRIVLAGTRGFTVLDRDLVGIYYLRRDPELVRTSHPEVSYHLGVFSASGDYLGSLDLPEAQSSLFLWGSRFARSFYLYHPLPYPHVVRYRLEIERGN